MRAYRLLCHFSFAMVFAALQQASAAQPMFTDMDLFIGGHDNVNIYRIPSLIVAPSGTILALIEAREGDDGDPTDLTLKRSLYTEAQAPRNLNGYPRIFGYGVNWEPMRTVLAGKGQAIMNPCPVLDKSTGRIWLPCYEVRGGLKEHIKDSFVGRVLLTWSDDEGVTWAPPRDLTEALPRFIPGPGVGVQLRTGRLVVPGYWASAAGAPARSCVAYSDDHAQTWRRGEPVKGNTDESQAVELSDGAVMLNCRSNRGKSCRYVACSRDGGETWFEEFDDPALSEPGFVCQGSMIRDPQPAANGAMPRLVFVNPTGGPGGRTNLTVKVSTDDGKTWSAGRTIEPGPAAYSSVATLKDGTIGVVYETGKVHPYEKISFARFNPEWLAGTKPRVIIPCGGGGWKDGQVQEPCILVNPKDAGKLVMFYAGMKLGGSEGSIAKAWADISDPFTWNEDANNPILTGKPGSAFDEGASLRLDSVIYNEALDEYWIYYTANSAKTHTDAIGLATCPAGKDGYSEVTAENIKRCSGNPILSPKGQGRDDETFVSQGAVFRENGLWYSFYSYRTATQTLPGIRLATSRDGKAWTKVLGPDLLAAAPEQAYIEWHQVYKIGNRYVMYYEGYNGGTRWGACVATSSSLTGGWTKMPVSLIDQTKWPDYSEETQFHVATPAIYNVNNRWYMYFVAARSGFYTKQRWAMWCVECDDVVKRISH